MFRRLNDSFMATFVIEKKNLMIIIKTSRKPGIVQGSRTRVNAINYFECSWKKKWKFL